MSNKNILFGKFWSMKEKLAEKKVNVTVANKGPSPDEIIAGIQAVQKVDYAITGGQRTIIVAELGGATFYLKDSTDTVVATGNTNFGFGGIVSLVAPSDGLYTVQAVVTAGGTELWTNTVEVLGAGVYEIKTGKPLNDYTEAQIAEAAQGGYAKYMWSVGDVKNTTFMGNTRQAVVVAFNHNVLAEAVGKAGITFMVDNHTITYRHWSSNDNDIGWEGSEIRTNGLKAGEYQYIIDKTVNGSTTGTRYTYSDISNEWLTKTLPADYVAGTKYYNRNIIASDGAFYAGLTSFKDYVKPVLNETADAGSNFEKIIKSKDYLFIMSECEIFGNTTRQLVRGRLDEGVQYDYFKNNYQEGKMCIGQNYWERSPNTTSATAYCYVISNGYPSSNIASSYYRVRPCFCL